MIRKIFTSIFLLLFIVAILVAGGIGVYKCIELFPLYPIPVILVIIGVSLMSYSAINLLALYNKYF